MFFQILFLQQSCMKNYLYLAVPLKNWEKRDADWSRTFKTGKNLSNLSRGWIVKYNSFPAPNVWHGSRKTAFLARSFICVLIHGSMHLRDIKKAKCSAAPSQMT